MTTAFPSKYLEMMMLFIRVAGQSECIVISRNLEPSLDSSVMLFLHIKYGITLYVSVFNILI